MIIVLWSHSRRANFFASAFDARLWWRRWQFDALPLSLSLASLIFVGQTRETLQKFIDSFDFVMTRSCARAHTHTWWLRNDWSRVTIKPRENRFGTLLAAWMQFELVWGWGIWGGEGRTRGGRVLDEFRWRCVPDWFVKLEILMDDLICISVLIRDGEMLWRMECFWKPNYLNVLIIVKKLRKEAN